MTHPWQDPAWQQAAHRWIEAELHRLRLTRTGEIEQPHVQIWSTVMRVPTDGGTVWFKANMESLRHEAATVELLAEQCPELVPPLLAIDREEGWMLLADAGERLREVIPREQSLDRWVDVLSRYAGLQVAMTSAVDALLAAGVPDLRTATLPERYQRLVEDVDVEQRFRDAVPLVVELCDRLSAYDIPETIQHDDLHDGQVFISDGRHLVMDWGDACISHPFFTLSVTLEGVISWGLDDVENSVDLAPFLAAYLEPFTYLYGDDVGGAVEPALRLGWACRAVNGHVPGDDGPTSTRLRMFLDGRP